ncbi:MAG: eL32 family ribosomal protein [Nanoarchaeota archaeon]|nr:eL32 family ribosomal protein [Nanoarchaeota archaeon]
MEKLLAIKKSINRRRPKFVRQEGTSKRMLQKVGWRKPKGYHSKIRRKFAGHRKMPNAGYRSPALVRGLNMQGLKPVLVQNVAEAAALVAKTDAAIIAKVGKKARVEILKKLVEAKVKILNILNPEKFIADVEAEVKKRKDEKKAKEEKKKKSKEESLKKAAEKKETEEKSEEDKKKEQAEEQRKVLAQPQ